MYIKYQETSCNFRLGFALSNRPHFNSTYLLRVPFSSGIAVFLNDFLSIQILKYIILIDFFVKVTSKIENGLNFDVQKYKNMERQTLAGQSLLLPRLRDLNDKTIFFLSQQCPIRVLLSVGAVGASEPTYLKEYSRA